MTQPNNRIETRYLDLMTMEAITGDNGIPIIRGISPVFNAISDVLADPTIGPFQEVIEPGALDKIWDTLDTRGRFDHRIILGRMKSGTLYLTKTDAGVEYQIFINPSDPEAVAAYEKVRRKDVDGASFMFTVADGGESWEMQPSGIPLRRVSEIEELMDVGPVTFPAYPQASSTARSKVIELRQQQPTPTEPEGEEGESLDADQKAARDNQTLTLMEMEIEVDQTKE